MNENREAAEAALDTSVVLESSQQPDAPLSDAAFNAPPAEEAKQPEAPKHPTTRDAIEKALEDAEGKEKATEEGKKPAVEPETKAKAEKPEGEEEKPAKARDETGKFAKGEEPKDDKSAAEKPATGQDGDKTARQSEGRNHQEPPARFLPKAKEVWANTPNPVKAEVARLLQEHEQEVSQYRESHEEYAKLAKFTDMAKQHNTTVNDALENYTRLDALIHSNPLEGIRQVMQTVGITPQQYAEYITKNPQAAQAPVSRAPDPVAQQTNNEVQSLKQEIAAMRQEQAARSIIDPFRATHDRYDELQGDIAFFLNSGKVPTNLSPSDRLEVAYDMAERINPRSMPAAHVPDDAPVVPRDVPSDAGTKSIRGAPAAGSDPARRRPNNNRDAAAAALAEIGI